MDDLVTRFDSKLVALEQVKHEARTRGVADVRCRTVAVVLDREQGGMEAAREKDVTLLSLIRFKTTGLPLLEQVINRHEWETILHYLEDPQYYQDREAQERLARLAPAKT